MRQKPSTYSVVRNLDIGESAFLPSSKWNAARSAASVLKRIFGSVYEVHVIMPTKEDIIITRIA